VKYICSIDRECETLLLTVRICVFLLVSFLIFSSGGYLWIWIGMMCTLRMMCVLIKFSRYIVIVYMPI
jgi:hypothetical protein